MGSDRMDRAVEAADKADPTVASVLPGLSRNLIEAALPVLEEEYARDFNDILDTAQEADEENVRRWDQLKARIRELENEIARLNGQTVSADEQVVARLAAADRLADAASGLLKAVDDGDLKAIPDAEDGLIAALAAYREGNQ